MNASQPNLPPPIYRKLRKKKPGIDLIDPLEHNPENIPERLIERHLGYRLLTLAEKDIMNKKKALSCYMQIEACARKRNRKFLPGWFGNCHSVTYRTKLTKEELIALPENP